MAITSLTFQIFLVGATERRILFTATEGLGQRYTYGPVITIDKAYNPKDHTAVIQGKIERRLAREEIDAWMEDPRRTPSLEYATKASYQARVDERKVELQVELSERQTKQNALRNNEGKLS